MISNNQIRCFMENKGRFVRNNRSSKNYSMVVRWDAFIHFSVVFTFFLTTIAIFTSVGKNFALKNNTSVELKNESDPAEKFAYKNDGGTTELGLTSDNGPLSFLLDPNDLGLMSTHPFSRYETSAFSSLVYKDSSYRHIKISEETLSEALNTLEAANLCKLSGNVRKAAKLYEHAYSLQPNHPKVLVEYGLFVETVKSDVLAASTIYTKAIINWPDDGLAKKHFSRTLPIVEEMDSQILLKLDKKRDTFIRIPRGSAALKRLMRESYVEHVYHTVAIEGNTMSLMQTRSILETHMAVGGKSVMEHNEILGLDAAMRFLNRSLIHKRASLDMHDILEIHRRVYGYVDPLEAGQFRRTQVYVGGFVPCPPTLIETEMNEFIDWLASETAQRVHPVELAALVHYKFVVVHPFVDGNGRTARLLMNLILMRAGFPPVIVRVDERAHYYEMLKAANDGDLRPFIRFVASCTDRTLDNYLQFTTEISQPNSNLNTNINTESMDNIISSPYYDER